MPTKSDRPARGHVVETARRRVQQQGGRGTVGSAQGLSHYVQPMGPITRRTPPILPTCGTQSPLRAGTPPLCTERQHAGSAGSGTAALQ